ncbi:hypothetical protein [[Clostridium] fimetarium]|uniref:Uncharacterized protein n=1 Tax=[Clostridium] fimetarium TaxID=99656 RepID=A0A1I0RPN4_9FIRM|nr:hypothetical protein [[Clostridium] fimetarium]SEW43156.1 hypothetical protein SAMN05421659_12036 [[Clostridium] fimetarium]
MRKALKKGSIVLLTMLLTVNCVLVTYASEPDATSITYEEAGKIFLENGYTKDVFSTFTKEHAIELATYLINDPDKVTIKSTTETFDELEGIAVIANSTEDELVEKYVIEPNKAKEMKEQIQAISSMSEEEIIEEYGATEAEAVILKEVATGEDNYKKSKDIEQDNKLQLDSVISSSQLTFTQALADVSDDSSAEYVVIVSWDFTQTYYPYDFTDAIAIAWGGTLVRDTAGSFFKDVYYNKMNGVIGLFSWGDQTSTGTPYISSQGQNFAVLSFPTQGPAFLSTSKAKSGSIAFRIKNSTRTGDYVTVQSQYCHKVLGFGSVSVSPGSSPRIGIEGAYNVSDLANTTTTIIE